MKIKACYFENASIKSGWNKKAINMFSIPDELLHHQYDEHLLLIDQHVHLLHQDDTISFWKCLDCISFEKIKLNMCIILDKLLHHLHDEHIILISEHFHLLYEDDILLFESLPLNLGQSK